MANTICAGVDAPSSTTYATQRGTIFLLPEESATLILEPLLFTVNSSYTSPRCIDSRHLKSIANSQPRATPVAMDDDGEPLVPQPNARFPRFLELPPELQIQIWEHAIKDTIPGTRDPRFGAVTVLHRAVPLHYAFLSNVGTKDSILVCPALEQCCTVL